MLRPKATAFKTGPSTWEVWVPGIDHSFGTFTSEALANIMADALNSHVNPTFQESLDDEFAGIQPGVKALAA